MGFVGACALVAVALGQGAAVVAHPAAAETPEQREARFGMFIHDCLAGEGSGPPKLEVGSIDG